MGSNLWPSGGAAIIARNVESRVTKLEARSARPDEMLVVWRTPDGDVAEALQDATFAYWGGLVAQQFSTTSRTQGDPRPSALFSTFSCPSRVDFSHIERDQQR
jgi:hypothetical protein